MSKVSTKINRIKRKLDNISGLDDDFIMSSVNKVDLFVDIILSDVENYLKENKLNGTIFKNLKWGKVSRSKLRYFFICKFPYL